MKGPNPFTLWEQDPTKVYGRKDESRIFNSFLNSTMSGQGGILMINGGPGTGKTAIMRYFAHLGAKNGLLTPFIRVEKGEGEDVLADKLQHEMGSSVGSRHTYSIKELVELADEEKFGTVFFIDNIDKLKKAQDSISSITEICRAGWNKKKVSFILSSTKEFQTDPELTKTIVLKNFEEHEARELVEESLGKGPPKMGEECFNSILNDTNGNPRLFKSVCYYVYDKLRENEKIISKGHYLAYLPHTMSMLSREWFGRMYQEVPAAEKEILLVIARKEEAHVSDIANELGKKLGPVTALVGRLKDRGQIVKIDRGRYKMFTKLYGRYVIQRS